MCKLIFPLFNNTNANFSHNQALSKDVRRSQGRSKPCARSAKSQRMRISVMFSPQSTCVTKLHFHLNFINLLLPSEGDSTHTLTWISPRLTDTAAPRGIHTEESLAFLILHSFFFASSPLSIGTTASGWFPPQTHSCHSPVCEALGSPFVWQAGASNVWRSNLAQTYKTWLIREMSHKRGPFPLITNTDRWSHFSFSNCLCHIPLCCGWFILRLISKINAT